MALQFYYKIAWKQIIHIGMIFEFLKGMNKSIHEFIKSITIIYIYYLIIQNNKLDWNYRIQNPEPGEYQICFDNTFSYQTRKVVYFEVYLYDKDGNLEEEDITKYAFSDPELQNKLQQIGMTVTQFQVIILIHQFLRSLTLRHNSYQSTYI